MTTAPAAMLMALLCVSACGAEPVTATGREDAERSVQVTAASLPAPPQSVSIVLSGRSAEISWSIAKGQAVDAFQVFVDEAEPVALPAGTRSHSLSHLKPGSSHLVQVVSVRGDQQSMPAKASIEVPYIEDDDGGNAESATAGSVADADDTSPATGGMVHASGVVNIPIVGFGCGNLRDYYKVQIHEEHDAYVGDADLNGKGRFVAKDICEWQFKADLDPSSEVYTFSLFQYRSGNLQDEQKMLTSGLAAGQQPVLVGRG